MRIPPDTDSATKPQPRVVARQSPGLHLIGDLYGCRGHAGLMTEAPALDPDTGRACQVLNHSPATIVVRCGRAHPWPILGVMPDAAWHGLLQARRTELEAVSCR